MKTLMVLSAQRVSCRLNYRFYLGCCNVNQLCDAKVYLVERAYSHKVDDSF